jgi:FkbM family methyltransferase
LKKKLVDLIYSSNLPDDKISILAFVDYRGMGVLDILQIIPKAMMGPFADLLNKHKPSDLHRLIHSNLPTSSLCGNRIFHVNCRTNFTGCAEFYTAYDGNIKNNDYNFTKETFRCHNLYITPENGVLSDGLINRMTNNVWEETEAKAIKDIDPNSSILDLGGCIGITSCILNKKLKNPNNHIVLEANPMLISSLEGIRNENLCKFKIENKILGTKTIEKIDFFINPHHAMDGSIFPDKRRIFTEQISQTTISELENKYSINFNALICDIEGAEWEMWQNILLHDNYFLKFHTIICEFHNILSNKNNLDSIIKHLNNQSYKIIKYSSQVYGFFKNKQ